MILYKAFYKNYELKHDELLGALVERRKGLRRKSRVESGLKWARSVFGRMARDKQAIFVVPHELKLNDPTTLREEKTVFSAEEFLWMLREVDRELKGKVSPAVDAHPGDNEQPIRYRTVNHSSMQKAYSRFY